MHAEIALIIRNEPLRDAILEQTAVCGMNARVFEKPQDISDDRIAITDDVSCLKEIESTGRAPYVLFIGENDEEHSASETFQTPFRLGHLMSRLRYYSEVAPLLRNRVIKFGPYSLSPQSRHITRDSNPEPIKLTEKETALLVFLSEKKEGATRGEILASVWGYDDRIDTRTLETHVYQLRRKLDADGENWITLMSGTYKLEDCST